MGPWRTIGLRYVTGEWELGLVNLFELVRTSARGRGMLHVPREQKTFW